jgi:hypothetical protein
MQILDFSDGDIYWCIMEEVRVGTTLLNNFEGVLEVDPIDYFGFPLFGMDFRHHPDMPASWRVMGPLRYVLFYLCLILFELLCDLLCKKTNDPVYVVLQMSDQMIERVIFLVQG